MTLLTEGLVSECSTKAERYSTRASALGLHKVSMNFINKIKAPSGIA